MTSPGETLGAVVKRIGNLIGNLDLGDVAVTATVPKAEIMGTIGLVGLVVNLGVGLLYRYRTTDSQALSVWLCARNDCITNIPVMLAGAGVCGHPRRHGQTSPWRQIIAGLSSAARIIRQALEEMHGADIPRGLPAE